MRPSKRTAPPEEAVLSNPQSPAAQANSHPLEAPSSPCYGRYSFDGPSRAASSSTNPTTTTTTTPTTQSRPSIGRGPRCPRHASSNTDACDCLVAPAFIKEEPLSERRSSTSTESTSSSATRHGSAPVRFKAVENPLAILPQNSWRLYHELIENETTPVQLANELSRLELYQGCELDPVTRRVLGPDSEETFASGVLRPIRSLINNFYFCGNDSGPVPTCATEAPTQITSRNVVVFFQRTGPGNLINEDQSRRRICGWATMWREHIRGIMARGGEVEACPPVPVIEVRADGRFHLTLIIDTGDEAFALDEPIVIGDTSSMQGLCRLRNASVYLNSWKKDVYLPWSKRITDKAQVVPKMETKVKMEPED